MRQGLRENGGWLRVRLGVLVLGACSFVATSKPDAHGGRILVFVAGSLAWGMVMDGFRPDRYDVVGLAGVPGWRRGHYVGPAKHLTGWRWQGAVAAPEEIGVRHACSADRHRLDRQLTASIPRVQDASWWTAEG